MLRHAARRGGRCMALRPSIDRAPPGSYRPTSTQLPLKPLTPISTLTLPNSTQNTKTSARHTRHANSDLRKTQHDSLSNGHLLRITMTNITSKASKIKFTQISERQDSRCRLRMSRDVLFLLSSAGNCSC